MPPTKPVLPALEFMAAAMLTRNGPTCSLNTTDRGCRRNEILTLRWDDVDRTAGELRLRNGKTGWRSVPLTPAGGGGA